MSSMGERVKQFDIPVCNKFKPTIYRDQLCYSVNINEILENTNNFHERKQMLEKGLFFLMDYNEERNIIKMSEKLNVVVENWFDANFKGQENEDARIYLDTIGRSVNPGLLC